MSFSFFFSETLSILCFSTILRHSFICIYCSLWRSRVLFSVAGISSYSTSSHRAIRIKWHFTKSFDSYTWIKTILSFTSIHPYSVYKSNVVTKQCAFEFLPFLEVFFNLFHLITLWKKWEREWINYEKALN